MSNVPKWKVVTMSDKPLKTLYEKHPELLDNDPELQQVCVDFNIIEAKLKRIINKRYESARKELY